jgi:hypothetical protein
MNFFSKPQQPLYAKDELIKKELFKMVLENDISRHRNADEIVRMVNTAYEYIRNDKISETPLISKDTEFNAKVY